MKTLYTRIVITYICISIVSSFIALILSNLYFQEALKEESREKALAVSEEIRALYEETPELSLQHYLSRIGSLGYQIYLVDSQFRGSFYGGPFRHTEFDPEQIKRVLEGETYNGILSERRLLALSYFENSIVNSVGIPIEAEGQTYAMFVRTNMEQQIGEIRILMAILLSLIFVCSTTLIVILTSFIVKPIKTLTAATNQIVSGQYDIELNVKRRDELGDLAQHFKSMAQSIKQLDDMRQEFVANVSHEFQSPLTSIQGFAQSILDKGVSSEEAERYLHIIADESKRLSSLSKQLLMLASLDKETTVLKKSEFRLDEQIRQIVILTEWLWTEKELDVSAELTEAKIIGDPQLLHQVWFNLITNSIKFSRQGGQIQISLRIGQDIAVTVSDTGIGISETELPHIFDRFYKADQSRSASRSGSGLGLSIVSKIVELHGGRIEVVSEPGKGAQFTVRLPRTNG